MLTYAFISVGRWLDRASKGGVLPEGSAVEFDSSCGCGVLPFSVHIFDGRFGYPIGG